ncbi:MAG: flippase [Rhodoferax sp.]|uniref:flippase n=1 Tax=Rhodoferax sp. TaxID=50421 RepID=UPI002625C87F|nr:flippase [Rhodoferax sp.]MDD5332957.1 flippase [Rhodoferax sp.]
MKVGAREVASSSVVLLAENLVRLTAVAAVSFWIARQLGPEQFGILNAASALVAILMTVATMGLDTPVILRLTQTQQAGEVLGAALVLRTVFGLMVFALAVVLAYVLENDDPVALSVTLVVSLSILLSPVNIFDYWFKAKTLPVRPAAARITGTLLAAIAKVACLLLGFGVMALAWTVSLEALVTSIGLVLAYLSVSPVHRRAVDRQLIVALVRESWPYLLSTTAIIIYMKIDVVMLGYLSTNIETGIYSLAQKLSEVIYMVPVVLVDSAYPVLARRFLDANQTTDSQHGQMLFDLAVGGSLVVTLLALILAGPVINAVFGAGYERSVNIFYIHAWSCVAIAMNTARHRWLAAVGLQRYAPTVTVIGLVINVMMNLVLIPFFGAIGAAIATVISYFLSGYFSSFLFPALREIGQMQTRALWPWARLYFSYKSGEPNDSR